MSHESCCCHSIVATAGHTTAGNKHRKGEMSPLTMTLWYPHLPTDPTLGTGNAFTTGHRCKINLIHLWLLGLAGLTERSCWRWHDCAVAASEISVEVTDVVLLLLFAMGDLFFVGCSLHLSRSFKRGEQKICLALFKTDRERIACWETAARCLGPLAERRFWSWRIFVLVSREHRRWWRKFPSSALRFTWTLS
jgi:hypothetical protein